MPCLGCQRKGFGALVRYINSWVNACACTLLMPSLRQASGPWPSCSPARDRHAYLSALKRLAPLGANVGFSDPRIYRGKEILPLLIWLASPFRRSRRGRLFERGQIG